MNRENIVQSIARGPHGPATCLGFFGVYHWLHPQ